MGEWENNKRRRQAMRRELIARDGPWCAACGREFPESKLTVDHIITRQQIQMLGLSHDLYWDLDNARLLCGPDNSRRGNRLRVGKGRTAPTPPSETAPGW